MYVSLFFMTAFTSLSKLLFHWHSPSSRLQVKWSVWACEILNNLTRQGE